MELLFGLNVHTGSGVSRFRSKPEKRNMKKLAQSIAEVE
jgi:hypothetical protein